MITAVHVMRERSLLDSIFQQKQGHRQPAMKVRNQMKTRVNIVVDTTKEKGMEIRTTEVVKNLNKLVIPTVRVESFRTF